MTATGLQRSFKGRAKCLPKHPDHVLLCFQRRWVEDKSRLKICEKSRQIGFTWTDALDSMEQAAIGNHDVWVSSRDEMQAKLYVDDSKGWADLYKRGGDALGLVDVIGEDGQKGSAYVLRMPSGKQIFSLSSNPDAQAGKRGTRKLDEFALHKNPKRLYDIAYPGITWGGILAIFSTHRGAANYFNTLIREIVEGGNPKGFSHHKVTLQDALDQGFLYKLQQRLPEGDPRMEMDEAAYFDYIRSGTTDEEAFLQEYMCVPEDEATAFITAEMLEGCSFAKGQNLRVETEDIWDEFRSRKGHVRYLLHSDLSRGNLVPDSWIGRELYLGIDFGRHEDLTTVWLAERSEGLFLCRAVIEMFRTPFYRQEAIYNPLLKIARRSCLDETGLGSKPVEDAQRFAGQWRVEGVTFSAPVKADLANPLRNAFEDRSIRIPYDQKVHADFRMIRKEITAAGNTRFVGEKTSTTDSHADRFWAAALALHAAADATGPALAAGVGHEQTGRFSRRNF